MATGNTTPGDASKLVLKYGMDSGATPIPVIGYARVSTDAQDNDISVPSQIDALQRKAAENGRYLDKVYTDDGFTGTNDNRPGFQEMLLEVTGADCHAKEIWVWDRSRFSRNNEDMVAYRAILRRKGIRLVSITQPSDDSPSGELTDGVIDLFNDYFVKLLKMQTRRGQRKVAEMGYWQSSTVPYGYTREYEEFAGKQKARLILDKATTTTAREIFDMALTGLTPLEIVRNLNGRGIPTATGKRWSRRTVISILKNPVYRGANVRGKRSKSGEAPTIYEGAFPSTVNGDEFQAVQDLIAGRAPTNQAARRSSSTHLLSGILVCDSHDATMPVSGGGKGKAKTYICRTIANEGAGSCNIGPLSTTDIEPLVLRKLLEHVLTDENLRDIINQVAQDKDNLTKDQRKKLKAAEKELQGLNTRRDNLLDYMERGAISYQAAGERMREIADQMERLEASVGELRAMEAYRTTFVTDAARILEYAKSIGTYLREDNVRRAQIFLKSFIKEIRISENKATIRYTVPMPPRRGFQGGDSEELALDEPVLLIGQPAKASIQARIFHRGDHLIRNAVIGQPALYLQYHLR